MENLVPKKIFYLVFQLPLHPFFESCSIGKWPCKHRQSNPGFVSMHSVFSAASQGRDLQMESPDVAGVVESFEIGDPLVESLDGPWVEVEGGFVPVEKHQSAHWSPITDLPKLSKISMQKKHLTLSIGSGLVRHSTNYNGHISMLLQWHPYKI